MLGKGSEKNTPKIVDKEENPVVKHRVHGENSVNFHQQTLFSFSLLGKTRLKISFHVFFRALGNRSGLVSHHFRVLESSELWIVAKRAAQQAADPSPHSSLAVFTNIFHC